jgi:hypothetical protein
MSALTRDRATPYREGIEVEYPVAANTKIYAGSLVCVSATGYAVPAADTSGYRFAGVAMEQVDNSDGSDGGKTVRLRRAGVGTGMYAADDHTFDDADGPTNDIKVGLLVKYVSATKGWIDIAR